MVKIKFYIPMQSRNPEFNTMRYIKKIARVAVWWKKFSRRGKVFCTWYSFCFTRSTYNNCIGSNSFVATWRTGCACCRLPCRVSLQALKPRGPDHAGTQTAPRDPLSRARRAGGRTLPIPLYIVGNFRRNSEVASASSLQLRNNTKDKNTTNVERTR